MQAKLSCLIVLMLCSFAGAQEASREAQQWWDSWEYLRGNKVSYGYLPKRVRMDVERLHKLYVEMPRPEPPEKSFAEYRKRYGVAVEDFDEQHKALATRIYHDWKFTQLHEGWVSGLIRAGFEQRFEDMRLPEKLDKSKGTYIVFIPFPCPSEKSYKDCEQFMLLACEEAQKMGAKVIIIRSYYGIVKSLEGLEDSDQSWRDEILALPKVFKKYIDSGTVILQDGLRLNMRATPWMFIMNDGRSQGGNNIQEAALEPRMILDKLERFRKQAEIDVVHGLLGVAPKEASREAQDWWNKWASDLLTGNFVPYFYLPGRYHEDIEKLYQKYLVVQKIEPPEEHFAKYREANKLTEEQFDEKHKALATRYYRDWRLTSENQAVLLSLIYAGFERRFQEMTVPANFDKKGIYIVFVPFPSPSEEVYKKCEQLMLTACETATKLGAKVVIVRGHYARADSIAKLADSNDPWSKEIRDLPTVFKKHVDSETLLLKDGLTLTFGTTPWAFLIRDGKTLYCGSLYVWTESTQVFVETLEKVAAEGKTPADPAKNQKEEKAPGGPKGK